MTPLAAVIIAKRFFNVVFHRCNLERTGLRFLENISVKMLVVFLHLNATMVKFEFMSEYPEVSFHSVETINCPEGHISFYL